MTIQVILDTNIIIFLSKGQFNLQAEIERLILQKHEIVILSTCMNEFDYLIMKEPKMLKHQKFAQKLLTTIKLIEFDPVDIKNTDMKIIEYAKLNSPNCVVVTHDRRLKKRLVTEGIPVIYYKSQSHLDLIGSF
ncbi:MAG: hypothetical protein FK733_13765 [Asgard group archaeon]|nr:hypothetical protein [Asgard group archaeon]